MNTKIMIVLVIGVGMSIWRTLLLWNQLHIVFCDVGQGDATLLRLGWFELLVDGGADEQVLDCLSRHLPYFDRTIEVMVASHPDADHIGGLPAVLRTYTVLTIVWNGERKQTADFLAFDRFVQSKEANAPTVIVPKHGWEQRVADQLVLQYWLPRELFEYNITQNSPKYETALQDTRVAQQLVSNSSNDGSIVLNITYNQVKILLMGDLEIAGEKTLLAHGLLDNKTVIKVGHHGSNTSSSMEFVTATRPEYSVLSVGKNNHFGHPSPEVVRRYDAVRSTILRTDEGGSVELLSNGSRVWPGRTTAW